MSENFALTLYQWRGVWGERQTPALQTGKGYCANLGHQEDETGFIYMRARYYEPSTGRFVSEDPARDGVNWYLYADGNAVNRVDASGLSGRPDTKLGGGWEIRIDGHLGDPIADMHIWYNGKEIGSIWNSGTWKHLYHDLSHNKARDLVEKLKAHSSKRVRGWAKVLGRAGYCSVVLYFEHDPLDFLAIMFDIAGDHETAAMIDQINSMM
jgi:RHS repeat-associated protein